MSRLAARNVASVHRPHTQRLHKTSSSYWSIGSIWEQQSNKREKGEKIQHLSRSTGSQEGRETLRKTRETFVLGLYGGTVGTGRFRMTPIFVSIANDHSWDLQVDFRFLKIVDFVAIQNSRITLGVNDNPLSTSCVPYYVWAAWQPRRENEELWTNIQEWKRGIRKKVRLLKLVLLTSCPCKPQTKDIM